MKTLIAKSGRLLGFSAAALLALATQAVAQPASPVGQWDCLVSGSGQNGILFLNFTTDTDPVSGLPTFEGIMAQAGHQGLNAGNNGGRPGGGSGAPRAGGSGTNSIINIFGGGFIEGSAGEVANNGGPNDWLADSRGHRGTWFFNSKGQVVGSFFMTLNATGVVTNFFDTCIDQVLSIPLTNGGTFNQQVQFCFTNPVFATNIFWGPASDGEAGFTNLVFTNNNFTVAAVGTNQNISFVGKVVPGKRLTLVGSSPQGKFSISGVPLAPVPTALAVDGFTWTGTKRADGNQTQEQFFLSDTGIPNYYGLNGSGPAYTYNFTNSFCMISAHKRIAFVVDEIPFSPGGVENLRATVGNFVNSSKAIGGNTLGDGALESSFIQFNARLSPFLAP